MGMFDDVRCEVPVPGEPQPKHPQFQTKDFECYLDSYTIKADGTLWRKERDDGEESAPLQVPFHGLLNFYTYEGGGHRNADPGIWFEYEAKFTDGKLQGIECVEISRQPFGGPRELIFSRAVQVTERAP